MDYLPDIFPPPFMFVSYHAVPQKVMGIKCFNHLLDNVVSYCLTLSFFFVVFHALIQSHHTKISVIIFIYIFLIYVLSWAKVFFFKLSTVENILISVCCHKSVLNLFHAIHFFFFTSYFLKYKKMNT